MAISIDFDQVLENGFEFSRVGAVVHAGIKYKIKFYEWLKRKVTKAALGPIFYKAPKTPQYYPAYPCVHRCITHATFVFP